MDEDKYVESRHYVITAIEETIRLGLEEDEERVERIVKLAETVDFTREEVLSLLKLGDSLGILRRMK